MRTGRSAAALTLAALVLCSGCLGFVTGSEPASFEASPAAASEAAVSETGYAQSRNDTRTVDRTFTVLGQNRTATVTTHVATYERRATFGPFGERTVGVFVAASTPAVSVGGKTFNPIAEYSDEELLQRFGTADGRIENASAVGSRNVTALGADVTVRTYAAEADIGGQRTEVFVHVATVSHEDDSLVAVGIYPRAIDGESETLRLVRGLRHPV